MPVRYDFVAAQKVSDNLNVLSIRLKDFIGMRVRARREKLDPPDAQPTTVPWVGKRRRDFEGEFEGEQASLIGLADYALELKRQIDRATTGAREARAAEQKTG